MSRWRKILDELVFAAFVIGMGAAAMAGLFFMAAVLR